MKKIITLLLSLIFITSCIPIMADTPALYKKLLVNDDFSNGTVGTGKIGEYNDNYIYSDAEGMSNRMLSVTGKKDSNYVEYRNGYFANVGLYDYYTIAFDAYFPTDDNRLELFLRNAGSGNTNAIPNFFRMSNSKLLHGTTVIYEIPTPKSHYRVELHIDWSGEKGKLDVYLDGRLAIGNVETSKNLKGIDRLQLRNDNDAKAFNIEPFNDVSPYCIYDNLLAYGIKEGPSFASIAARPAYNAEKIDFTLAGNVVYSTLTTDTVKLVCSDGDIPLDKVVTSAAGGTLSVYPKYNLDADTSYTVTIQNGKTNVEVFAGQPLTQAVSYTFTTLPENRGVSNSTWVPSSGEITFEADLSSANEGDDICVILTLWDGNKLVGVKAVKYTHAQISSDDNAVVTITGAVAGNKVKAMVVDNFDNPTRVGKPIYEYVVN